MPTEYTRILRYTKNIGEKRHAINDLNAATCWALLIQKDNNYMEIKLQ